MELRPSQEKALSLFKYLALRGYHLKQQYAVGAYRIDIIALCGTKKVAIECDREQFHSSEEAIRADMERQSILRGRACAAPSPPSESQHSG